MSENGQLGYKGISVAHYLNPFFTLFIYPLFIK